MKQNVQWKQAIPGLMIAAAILLLSLAGINYMGQESFVRTTLSGLTIGALYFMVASGLTIIFGLMDVLNFAHGAMFMTGAYIGWQFYTNPTFLFGLFPLILAFMLGIATSALWLKYTTRMKISASWQPRIRNLLILGGCIVGIWGIWGLDILGLAETALVAAMMAGNPLGEISAQEPLSIFWMRPVLLALAGMLIAFASARPGDHTQIVPKGKQWSTWIQVAALFLLTIIATIVRESGPIAVLTMNANLRFFLALIIGAAAGAGLGTIVEVSLIRPLYSRPFYIVLVTLGIGYVLREVVQLLWGPVAYAMARPPAFAQPGKAENLFAWLSGNNLTVDILGVTFPSYRIFIIVLGVLMLIGLAILMRYSRLGMIIRAGVQDRQMVEALGINVRRIFSIVFAMGIGLAALGGIGAAPFIPVQPNMGDVYQLQGFIVVVIGGMGSYGGAAIGALLLGMARAFGDFLCLKFSLSPAIAEASTVIIMAIILLVRPSGLLGKKE
ncbi:MAG: branched-chain amino acid ABC transporter permease [Anaerolineaceae bacterium]|nr:branched-chain amino acid ABC transporter permease [Anaerolineaceae bacterium]